MVTGSHNPPDYNGLKMVLAGETLSGEVIQGLRQRIETNDKSLAIILMMNTSPKLATTLNSHAQWKLRPMQVTA